MADIELKKPLSPIPYPRCDTEADLLQSIEHLCCTEDSNGCLSAVKSVDELIC